MCSLIDDSVKGRVIQFWELFTVILCAPSVPNACVINAIIQRECIHCERTDSGMGIDAIDKDGGPGKV